MNPIMFQPPYQEKAPCVVNAVCRLGQVIERIKLKNHVVEVARDMPTVRIYRG